MSKSKGLKTYSKTKKLINQSELLFSEITDKRYNNRIENYSNKNQSDEEMTETDNLKQEEISENIENEPEKRSLRPKRATTSSSNIQKQIKQTKQPTTNATTTRKRKNTLEKEKEEQKEVDENQNEDSTRKRNNYNQQNIPKLFELTDNNLEDSSDKKQTNTRTKRTTTRTNKKNESNENASNISESATATAIINSGLSIANSIDENRMPKSIMKTRDTNVGNVNENYESKETDEAKVSRPKRAVRILEDLSEKTDKILKVKCDNKHKHTASTSTPSGLRRKPLKAPQDVSIIIRPEVEQSI